jgi:hypothetical protein
MRPGDFGFVRYIHENNFKLHQRFPFPYGLKPAVVNNCPHMQNNQNLTIEALNFKLPLLPSSPALALHPRPDKAG